MTGDRVSDRGGKEDTPAVQPGVDVSDWEESSIVGMMGRTWEERRPRRRWSNERYRMSLILRKNLSPGADLLDAGCGPGFYIPYYLERAGAEHVYLVDQSAQMLEYCRRQYPALRPQNLSRASVYSLPFPDGRFDAVINCDVLMHIPHYRKALSELYRVCRPDGGRLFLRVNLTDGPTYGDLPSAQAPDPGHIYWIAYGREEFGRALKEIGPASLTIIDRICRKPFKRGGDPFIADAAIVILTRGEPRRRLRLGSRLGHLLTKPFTGAA